MGSLWANRSIDSREGEGERGRPEEGRRTDAVQVPQRTSNHVVWRRRETSSEETLETQDRMSNHKSDYKESKV